MTSSTDGLAIASGAVVTTGARAIAIGKGRASGADAISLQITDNTATYGASGASSVAGGYRARATGSYSAVLAGLQGVASGNYSGTLAGDNPRALHARSVALGGSLSLTLADDAVAWGGGPYGGSNNFLHGDALTVDATASPILSLELNQGGINGIYAAAFHGIVVAWSTGTTGTANNVGAYVVQGAVKFISGVPTLVGTPTVTTLGENVTAWNVTVTVSGTTLNINAIGQAATEIAWRASINCAAIW